MSNSSTPRLSGPLKAAVAVIIAAALGFAAAEYIPWGEEETVASTSVDRVDDTWVIESLTFDTEIVLMQATLSGIREVENNTKIFGDRRLWGSSKTAMIYYSYVSKLGFDAEEVNIAPRRDNRYEITIPEFQMIGYNDIDLETVHTENGLSSIGTEDIDTAAVSAEILDGDEESEKVKELIEGNRTTLEAAAADHYRNLALEFNQGNDADIELNFKFK